MPSIVLLDNSAHREEAGSCLMPLSSFSISEDEHKGPQSTPNRSVLVSLCSPAVKDVIEALTSPLKEVRQERRSKCFVSWRLIGIHLEREGEKHVPAMAQMDICLGLGEGRAHSKGWQETRVTGEQNQEVRRGSCTDRKGPDS